MNREILQFLLFLFAVSAGWLAGYWFRPRVESKNADASSSYYKGLNYLLSEQPDAAVMTVINDLPVNLETLPTHLALGNLMRSKGEVDGAIRVHQNLLSRPSLPRDKLHQVHLELARDYISAGVLDRAERLLKDVVEESEVFRSEALEHLQHIYQTEREWDQAIAVALRRLPPRSWLKKAPVAGPEDRRVECALSHFYCERAQQFLTEHNFKDAVAALQSARQFDRDNVRAYLLSATIALKQHKPQLALDLLHTVVDRQAVFGSEILPLFRQAFDAFASREAYLDAVLHIAKSTESSAFIIEAATLIEAKGDTDSTHKYLLDSTRQRPTLSLLAKLLEQPGGGGGDALELVQEVLQKLRAERPAYRCRQCGFSGRKLHWLCPSCEQWGTITPIRGIQGD
ncbi:lipopolysaccharide assembly protein LapB [Zhongshania sp.]|uniref:lipopolysaccharide assembly protein LapB n=1 Tax=Zhongshania sp. TaxID=1971902 RepID=UPI003562CB8D